MRDFTRQRSRRDGSALMATLAVVAALALMVVLVSRVLRDDQKYVMARQARMEALAWAEAGIAIASHPVIKRGDPALMWTGPAGEGYQVTLQAEDARLNPAKVLGRGDDQLLEALFTLWGMDMDTISALVGAMRDWVDADDLESLNGAEEGGIRGKGASRIAAEPAVLLGTGNPPCEGCHGTGSGPARLGEPFHNARQRHD